MPTAVFPNMVAGAHDVEHDLLVKLAYWLQFAAETAGGANSYTMLLPSMAPNYNDSRQALLVKATYWAKQISDNISSGGTQEVYTGAAPPAAPADPTKGAVFYPSGGGAIQQWDVGSAAWI